MANKSMQGYTIKKRFFDSVNFLEFAPGQLIETDEEIWINRIGSVFFIPTKIRDGQRPTIVKGTIDQKNFDAKIRLVKEEIESVIDEVKVPVQKITRRRSAKIVDEAPESKS